MSKNKRINIEMKLKLFLLSTCTLILALFSTMLSAQIGGRAVFESLNLAPSARITGLGGSLITIKDKDLALAFVNPALLNEEMHNALAFSHDFHLGGLSHGYAGYGHSIESAKMTLQFGVQYFSAGEIDAYDALEQSLGKVNASEQVIGIGASKQLYERLAIGVNLKAITSRLASFNSFGLVADIGAVYEIEEQDFSAALLFRNAGRQINPYVDGNIEPVPFEIQFGISKRLKYLPFRLSVIAHQLQQWDIRYNDPDQNSEEENFFGEPAQAEENSFSNAVDNFFRHLIFNGEFLLGANENLRIRFGYNHLRRSGLRVEGLRGLSGFSFGLGIKVSRFHIDFGQSFYHLGGSLTHFGFTTNLGEFIK